MTEEELQEIKAINAARTPGKWRLFTGIKGLVEVQIAGVKAPIVGWPGFDNSDRSTKEHRRNAAFIARASRAVPDMVAEVERLRDVLNKIGYQSEGLNNEWYAVLAREALGLKDGK